LELIGRVGSIARAQGKILSFSMKVVGTDIALGPSMLGCVRAASGHEQSGYAVGLGRL